MSSPVVSVIIPTYNRAQVVGRAIRSVLAQTYPIFEAIVCDDGSTDRTKEVISAFEDPRISVLTHGSNQGSAVARNTAVDAARGTYLAFLDSDDEWRTNKLALQIEALENAASDVGVCFCSATLLKNEAVAGGREYRPRKCWEENPYKAYALDKLSFLTPTVMMKRRCYLEAGGMDPRLRRGQDGDLLMRVFQQFGLVVLTQNLTTIHLDSSKSTGADGRMAALIKCDKYRARIREDLGWYCGRVFVANRYWNVMTADFRERAYFSGLCYMIRSLCQWPIQSRRHYRSAAAALIRSLPKT